MLAFPFLDIHLKVSEGICKRSLEENQQGAMIDDNRGPTFKKTLFWLHCMELGILIPPPGIESVLPAMENAEFQPVDRQGITYMLLF